MDKSEENFTVIYQIWNSSRGLLVCDVTLRREAAWSTGTLLPSNHVSTRRDNAEHKDLNLYRRGNLKSYNKLNGFNKPYHMKI